MMGKYILLKEIAKDFFSYEGKMALRRFMHRYNSRRKQPYLVENGLVYELKYDLQFVPWYVCKRLVSKRNRKLFSLAFKILTYDNKPISVNNVTK